MTSFASSQRDALHAMSESNTNKPDPVDRELNRLAAISDDDIDTSDISELKDWSRAERGKFYRPGAARTMCRCISIQRLQRFSDSGPQL